MNYSPRIQSYPATSKFEGIRIQTGVSMPSRAARNVVQAIKLISRQEESHISDEDDMPNTGNCLLSYPMALQKMDGLAVLMELLILR